MNAFHRLNRFAFAGILLVALLGCGAEDPMKLRMDEFRYTTDQLADELAPRLAASQRPRGPGSSGPDAATQRMAEIEAVRGGDGDRPDPNSLDAIVMDAVVKVRGIAGTEATGPVADELQRLLAEKPGVDEPTLEKFNRQVRDKLSNP